MADAIEMLDDRPLPPKYGAIHRALLAGLLSHVGHRTEDRDYQGPRGRRFHIHPSSGLFKQNAPWIVAAELVQTTRLYARTVARIRPEWVEQVAGHLVQREYWDPHWDKEQADVQAFEDVVLQGVHVVAKRPVNYGPIDPGLARELFIRHALVEGQYRTDAPFYQHNRRLIEEVEKLEAKVRKRNVLVDAEVRFAFYDRRIPPGVYNGRAFEQWRREAERRNPRLLFMSRRDLMVHGAADITADQFPDAIQLDGVRLPLDYRLEHGHPADGVTATVPLAALGQLPEARFDWLVPGLLKEKVVALIRSLPKPLRIDFVPAPDSAEKAVQSMRFGDGALLPALADALGKLSGKPIRAEDFDPKAVPEPLRMNFRIVDDSGRQLAMGRDLEPLRKSMAEKLRASFASLPPGPFTRQRITHWDFGDLPQRVTIKRWGMSVHGHPALVDKGDSVALQLFESPHAADAHHRDGVRRLFLLQFHKEFRQIEKNLPQVQEMGLYYASLGSASELRHDLMAAIAERALRADTGDIRTQEQYRQRSEEGWLRLEEVAVELATFVHDLLKLYHGLALQLSAHWPPLLQRPMNQIKSHMADLLGRGFLARTPPQWLRQFPRYVKAAEARLKKLTNAGLKRDAQLSAQLDPLWEHYRHRLARHRAEAIEDPELVQYRWMLEEYQVALFAQELKLAAPISPRRLEQQWARVRPA